MAWYIWAIDDKSPIFYGPYRSEDEAFRKKMSLSGLPHISDTELLDLPTNDRAKAIRMAKEQMQTQIVNFRHGS